MNRQQVFKIVIVGLIVLVSLAFLIFRGCQSRPAKPIAGVRSDVAAVIESKYSKDERQHRVVIQIARALQAILDHPEEPEKTAHPYDRAGAC